VSLTYAGSEFYSYASSVVEDMTAAERRMSDISRGRLGSLRIFILPDAEMTSARYISAFHRRYPEIRISLSSGTGKQQIMAINQSSHDIYFPLPRSQRRFPGLRASPSSLSAMSSI
jgi:DNA-binding transcriptional LysR family regulator